MDKNVYVSIDMDVIDPSQAPGVNIPEPLGLSSKEFFYLFRRILHLKNLKAIDVVEIVPEKDEKHGFVTVKLGAKILQEFLEKR